MSYPVKVYLCNPGERGLPVDQAGESRMFTDGNGRPQRFEILIRRGMPWNETQSVLWHEHAHCLRWHLPLAPDDSSNDDRDSILGIIENRINAKWHE